MGGKSPKQRDSAQAIALAETSAAEWMRYQDVFAPFEDELIANVRRSTLNVESTLGSTATSGYQNQDAMQRTDLQTNARAAGMDSGRTVMGLNTMGNRDASDNAFKSNRMRTELDMQNMRNIGSLVSVGRGQAAQGLQSLGNLASTRAARDQQAAQAAMQAGAQRLQAVGQVAGMAYGGYKNAGAGGGMPSGLSSPTYSQPIG